MILHEHRWRFEGGRFDLIREPDHGPTFVTGGW